MKSENNEVSLLDCFRAIYADDVSKDYKLLIGNECVMVHKLILTNRCNYFKQLLTEGDGISEDQNKEQLIIEDCGVAIVQAFVQYLYTDEINNIQELAEDLVILADKYGMNYLKQKTEGHLLEKVNVDTAVDYLIFSDKYNCMGLKSKSLLVIRDHIRVIKKSEDFNKLDGHPHLYKSIIDMIVPDDVFGTGACQSPNPVFSTPTRPVFPTPKRQFTFTPPLPAPQNDSPFLFPPMKK